ncbi:hypothetical protein GE21DRAFT_1345100 [Neurospora crassa]|nr:hypothetical protein GE21DRAFT_1345100 [Neurospora crassa]
MPIKRRDVGTLGDGVLNAVVDVGGTVDAAQLVRLYTRLTGAGWPRNGQGCTYLGTYVMRLGCVNPRAPEGWEPVTASGNWVGALGLVGRKKTANLTRQRQKSLSPTTRVSRHTSNQRGTDSGPNTNFDWSLMMEEMPRQKLADSEKLDLLPSAPWKESH